MKSVRFPDGRSVPALGQGTWMMGESRNGRADEIAALRAGIERGMTVIDTAEMYGDGATETLVGEALAGVRDEVFLVSKALPSHAGGGALARACENSLRRLRTDRLDLYLLHWRGGTALADTVRGMEKLKSEGKIRGWGVSNLDTDDMDELEAAGGSGCQTNQILYNLGRRGPEYDLLPWLGRRTMPVMAYSPLEQGRLAGSKPLGAIARSLGVEPLRLALAWVLSRPSMLAIPKAGTAAHVAENAAAADLVLSPDTLAALDEAFPPPRRKQPLELL